MIFFVQHVRWRSRHSCHHGLRKQELQFWRMKCLYLIPYVILPNHWTSRTSDIVKRKLALKVSIHFNLISIVNHSSLWFLEVITQEKPVINSISCFAALLTPSRDVGVLESQSDSPPVHRKQVWSFCLRIATVKWWTICYDSYEIPPNP